MTNRRLKDPELKKLIGKILKLTLKNGQKTKVCANFELETHFQALQNTVVSIAEVYISI